MKKKILLKGPILTRSGYGEQTRFAFRSLLSRPDLYEVYIQPLQWGHTSWLNDIGEERTLIDNIIEKTIGYIQQGGGFDMSLQVTIPNEWEKIAPVNVGYTAGIETTHVSSEWLQAAAIMDKIIVVSNHSKKIYENTQYDGVNEQTGEPVHLALTTEVEAVNYPIKSFEETPDLGIDLDYDFNFLTVAQWGPRKNLQNTIKWFVEEFENEEVGLVVKTNMAKNCLMDKMQTEINLRNLLTGFPDRKCKVYLLHGDMTDAEVHALYVHPQLKAYVGLPHGEGFGLPFFEAAYSGMPVVATGWSGQLDFLYDEENVEHFYNVTFDIQPVQKEVVWPGVIVEQSMWAYPRENSSKQKMRECFDDITNNKKPNEACEYAKSLAERFSPQKMYKKFADAVWSPTDEELYNQDLEALKDSADLAANVGLM